MYILCFSKFPRTEVIKHFASIDLPMITVKIHLKNIYNILNNRHIIYWTTVCIRSYLVLGAIRASWKFHQKVSKQLQFKLKKTSWICIHMWTKKHHLQRLRMRKTSHSTNHEHYSGPLNWIGFHPNLNSKTSTQIKKYQPNGPSRFCLWKVQE